MATNAPVPGVTLLVCTYNGAKRLPETLRHVAAQQVPAGVLWEALVISNASNDETLAVAETLGRELTLTLRVLDEPKPGKENALIRGFDKALYEFIVIDDDDNWLSPNYVGLVYEIMQAHPEIGVLGGRAEGAFEVAPPAWFEQFQAVYAVGPQNGGKSGQLPERQVYLYGAGSVVRQSGWRKLLDYDFHFTTSAKWGNIIVSGEDVWSSQGLERQFRTNLKTKLVMLKYFGPRYWPDIMLALNWYCTQLCTLLWRQKRWKEFFLLYGEFVRLSVRTLKQELPSFTLKLVTGRLPKVVLPS